MSEITVGIVGLLLLVVIFLTGLELGFSMAILGFLGFSYIVSMKAAFGVVAQDIFDILGSYGFSVIPVFVLMGQVAFNAGIAGSYMMQPMIRRSHPGGLAMATVGGATVFGSVTGIHHRHGGDFCLCSYS